MKTLVRPPFFHAWEGLDVGFVDRTGWVAGYVDFMEGLVVVEDEFTLDRASTQDIADAIEAHERGLWGDDRFVGGFEQPHVRISDIDHRLIMDLHEKHGLKFQAIDHKNLSSDVNLVNVLIAGKQLVISEKCEQLRRQLREGVWNKAKKDMAKDALGGHFDLLAALRYGVRKAHMLLRANPYPAGYRETPASDDRVSPRKRVTKASFLPDTPLTRRMMARHTAGRGVGTRGRK